MQATKVGFAAADAVFDASFAGQVVELCLKYENVFCDLADMGELFDLNLRPIFQKRLEAIIRKNAIFAKKLMYGSDYPMTLPRPWKEFLPAVEETFASSPFLAPFWPAVSRDNAIRFLNIPRFLERSADWISSR